MPTKEGRTIDHEVVSKGIIDFINELGDISDSSDTSGESWRVVVFNNETNSFQEVIDILVVAIRCSTEKAEAFASEIHHRGLSVVYMGSKIRCEKISSIIATIGIKVLVDKAQE